MRARYLAFVAIFAAACGSSPATGDGGTPDGGNPGNDGGNPGSDGGNPGNDGGNPGKDGGNPGNDGGVTPTGKVIFVVPMENQDYTAIIGNPNDAPYINNTLLVDYATASNFTDELNILIPSEPHYIWMESGTNKFSDHTFSTDNDSSSSNSTSSTAHLVAELDAAKISWTSYQEGITKGTCPITSNSGTFYAAKHDPFVFFQDVAGAPPSSGNTNCASHHKPLSDLAGDITGNAVAQYNFVTPNLCHDMHGAGGCPQSNTDAANIQAGDTWLKDNLQPMIDYAIAHDGYVFVIWDEGSSTLKIPFIAIGKNVKVKYSGSVAYTHSSLLKSEEEILGVSVQSNVTSANDFADLFTQFP